MTRVIAETSRSAAIENAAAELGPRQVRHGPRSARMAFSETATAACTGCLPLPAGLRPVSFPAKLFTFTAMVLPHWPAGLGSPLRRAQERAFYEALGDSAGCDAMLAGGSA